MDFITKVNLPKFPFAITHHDKLLLLGSCFTENIGNYLSNYQFKNAVNPFGIIYNPVSIFTALEKISNNYFFTEKNLIKHDELYISLDHHGVFSGLSVEKVLEKIYSEMSKAHDIFNESKYIIITLGSSFVYHHIEENKIVANCHKIPNTQFEKRLLSIEEIVEAYNKIGAKLKNKKVLFTVSPVRHWRDGAMENLRSKSILIESIHRIIEQNDNCFYFPAYEIMMDELRDYRFYNEDMLHPNAIAIKYIWLRFAEIYFDTKTHQLNKNIEKINLLLQHRIKNTSTKAHKEFEHKVKKTIENFKTEHPEIEVNF